MSDAIRHFLSGGLDSQYLLVLFLSYAHHFSDFNKKVIASKTNFLISNKFDVENQIININSDIIESPMI